MDLPQPRPEELALSEQLALLVREEIAASGPLSFAHYMQRALYEPGLGYYLSGAQKFGADGDFVTAPEISPLFSRCLAAACVDLMRGMEKASILEFGAGSGAMAAEILLFCRRQSCLPERYYILELSAELRERQRQTIAARTPDLLERVAWLDAPSAEPFSGVVLANEVLDAMPVERFVKRGDKVNCLAVDYTPQQGLHYVELPATDELQHAVAHIERDLHQELPDAYCSEVSLLLSPWLNTLAGCLQQAVVLLVDYGYSRRDYYLPERSMGTLMCHFRQRAHDNALLWPGLQDITAHVDFTAVAEAASAAGLDVTGFTGQARFLLESGMEAVLQDAHASADPAEYINLSQQAKMLLLPGQMGERFKVMALSRHYNRQPAGFSNGNDQRQYL